MREALGYLLSFVVGVPLLMAADLAMKVQSIPFMLRAASVKVGQSRKQIDHLLFPVHRREEFLNARPPFAVWYAGLGVSYKDARVQVEFDADGRAIVVHKIWGNHF